MRLNDTHLIKPRRQRLDRLHDGSNLCVLFPCHLGRDKYAKMPYLRMDHIDDALPANADFLDIRVAISNPVQRLLRRRDIIAVAREDNDRCAHILDVNGAARFKLRHITHQSVAHKYFANNPADLFLIQTEETTPPALKFKEAIPFRVDLGEKVIVFLEVVSAGILCFKIHDKVRAVENTTTNVGQHHWNPGAAADAGCVAHRVLANLAGPRCNRGAIQHDRPSQVWIGSGKQQGCPTALAIADDHGFWRLRMQACDLAHKFCLGARYIRQRLAWDRVPSERDEINGVASSQGYANLAVILETADASTMPRTRINNDVGALRFINDNAFRGTNFQEHVIAWPRQAGAIQRDFVVIDQDRRATILFMFNEDISPFAQRIHGEHQALSPVTQIVEPKSKRVLRTAR